MKRGIVVVAEDEEPLRNSIAQFLENAGFSVVTAKNGKVALALIEREARRYHVLIADLDMPEKSGDELIRELDAGAANFSAYILISGHTADYPPIIALQGRALRRPLHFLHKPFHAGELTALLEQVWSTQATEHVAQ